MIGLLPYDKYEYLGLLSLKKYAVCGQSVKSLTAISVIYHYVHCTVRINLCRTSLQHSWVQKCHEHRRARDDLCLSYKFHIKLLTKLRVARRFA